MELIVGLETVAVDLIKLNHSVIPSAHVYVIMVVVDMAFGKMYNKRRETLLYEKIKLNHPYKEYIVLYQGRLWHFFHCRAIVQNHYSKITLRTLHFK